MTYVVSDIHGELEQLQYLIKEINLSEKDMLYILGDVVDRGPHPIKTLQFLMALPNVVCIAGNHEIMAMENLKLLMNEITDEFLDGISIEDYGKLTDWILNGADSTIREFSALSAEEKQDIMDFMGEFIAYEELTVNGQDYLFVHAGIDNFSKEKCMEEYALDDFVWCRIDYEIPYYEDIKVISGHTPTQTILGNTKPGYIFKANNHIAIDCGAYRDNGRLALYCLETGEEFYSR